MIGAMAKAKTSVTVPPSLVSRPEDTGLNAMFDAMLVATGGPLTNCERVAADAALGIRGKNQTKRRGLRTCP
jgi:hypothetical protein